MKCVIVLCIFVSSFGPCFMGPATMKRTVTNEKYHGLLEAMSVPVELHTDPRDGATFASFEGAVPIHRCPEEEVGGRAATTHHYTGVFTEHTLAPLAELAYVRIDDNTVEKVFVNRKKRLLVRSHDGRLAAWRCAPSFESSNRFVAGTPVVSAAGALLALLTARHGNHYALSNVDGSGGYFDTSESWKVVPVPEGHLCYGTQSFPSREALREHVASLPPGAASPSGMPVNFTPALLLAGTPRITLTADTGRQVAHNILEGVIVKDVEYL